MAGFYTTEQGDTWDLIAYKLFGDESYMKDLIEENWDLADVLVFSSGTEISIPDLDEEDDELLPPWRQENPETSDDDDELEEFVEDDEEDEEEEDEEDAETSEGESEL